MKEEWLLNGAAVPVTCETVTELIAEIKRLIDVVGGMALAQPEQEPVAWMQKDVLPLTHVIKAVVRREKDETYTEPLYTTPPQRTWVGLTDEEIEGLRLKTFDAVATNHEVCRAIEAKLREKNA